MSSTVSKRECVKVIVRCRPLSDKETAAGYTPVVEVDRRSRKVTLQSEKEQTGEKEYIFDAVHGKDSTQEEIFEESVRPLVEAVLQGFNGTIFAYGQTGTGKTHTMQGSKSAPGIIPRAMEMIFQHIEASADESYLVNASYLEIYQEELRDLLRSPKKDKDEVVKKIELKEDVNGIVYAKHLSQYQLKSFHHMEKMMERGQSNRSVGATDMNEYSSRSHAIFVINIECGHIGPDGKEHVRVGKLNLVDLAGSEKQSKANSSGERFKEATQINLSLSTLGKVITSLVEKAPHIPYRDSKLTRLLQDSLGGNSKTIMVANVGPASYNIEETLSTLRYANRAKNIKNTPHINEDPKDAKLREYLDELAALKVKLSTTKSPSERPTRDKRKKEANDDLDNEEGSDSERYAQEHAALAQEKQKILANTNLGDKEKERLLSESAVKEEDLRKREAERQELRAKVDAIEQRMLRGNTTNVHERMTAQRENLQRKQKELDQQRETEKAILDALELEQREAVGTQDTVTTLKTDIDTAVLKIAKLQNQLDQIQGEIDAEEGVTQQFHEKLGDQLEHLRQREALMWTMVNHFISPATSEPMLQRAVYNEKSAQWVLPNETADIIRPPLFVDLSADRSVELRAKYQALLCENILDLVLDESIEDELAEPLIDMDTEDGTCALLLAEALEAACSEEDIVIDADVYTIERPHANTDTVGGIGKENVGRRSTLGSSKAFRSSPDHRPEDRYPSSRGLLK
ncbi:Kinesin-like protein KIF3B [Hypsibius exemplaris]|uniref:Kinesin-like protein n=1 Tax=Hypsibius exemplaris TaxID=2072580 RepID=A0A1W0WN38_HYPEX|nr:Kinesin-like protein KIF3B [Hypsibius exemplaris]